ncbi:AbrB family transcriptional regulator [Stakelama saccharophila]|uniref:AbrB family transcriptional regulator n=1 Tax=Stakelama saccharophila TaxID=3075605 RepID=A0ABZ0B9Y7_9SPHN|nr:AbrB family transcriptional regulator [Stakelama sp. W311]WNO53124.1 AbrB family transcriptional regulator [Stakelama sp. W311]
MATPDRGGGTLLLRWAALAVLSAGFAAALELAGIPAGLLLGPMLGAILLAAAQRTVPIARPVFYGAQALVGCLIAGAITTSIFTTLADNWALFAGVIAATLSASSLIGYMLSRWQVLPGTAAIWGSTPGAATAMVLMAQASGADARLVAVMTYSRVVCVAVTASILSAIFLGRGGGHGLSIEWVGAFNAHDALVTIAVAGAGAVAGLALRLPAGALIGPIILGSILNLSGAIALAPPQLLLALGYAVVGWRIGLGFTRDTIRIALRALPRILLAIGLLILFCGGLALLLAWRLGIDLVTAYLATSPGGADSVTIIAASTQVDIAFVVALQMVRFVTVLLVGPPLAGLLAKRFGRNAS